MNLQQIYNATYNHFAEKEIWPQYIDYDENWKISRNDNIKHAFDIGKRDGLKHYLQAATQNLTEEVALKMVEQMPEQEKGRRK